MTLVAEWVTADEVDGEADDVSRRRDTSSELERATTRLHLLEREAQRMQKAGAGRAAMRAKIEEVVTARREAIRARFAERGGDYRVTRP